MDLNVRRVLVCLRYGIGDVVMELPVLEALRRALPEAHITALGAEPATELLRGHDAVDDVVALNRWGILHRWDRGPAEAARAIGAWLDERRFELFLDVHHVTPLFGEIVWGRGVRSLEADEAVERAVVARGGSGVEAIRAAVEVGWGVRVHGAGRPRITPPTEQREAARAFLRAHGLGDSAPVGISPVASLTLKQWPLERLARVADALVEQTGDSILAFCGSHSEAADALRRQMKHRERLVPVGPFSLLRVAALLERCRAFLCNDTGLMHLAAAVGVPTVAVFGPTAPSIYRPPGSLVVSVGGTDVDCEHRNTASLHPPACFAAGRCLWGGRGCIEQAAEHEVLRAMKRMLDRSPRISQATASIG